MKEIEGEWCFKGQGDLERDYQNLLTKSLTAGEMVDYLLAKYPYSRIQIESNASNVLSDKHEL